MADTQGSTVPNNFRDPFWTNLASSAAQRQGVPPELLVSVLTNGERSNADQVSEAGGRTPFQVTPTTRDLVLKRNGIDAYLSPQNAADAAALVLKDGMQWAKARTNDPAEQTALAAGYYHAGGDPANWGKKTSAYVQRVVGGLQGPAPQGQTTGTPGDPGAPQVTGMSGPSTFDRVMAQQQQQQAPSQIQSVYDAYQSGQMSPDEAQEFEQDVRAGKMMLPRGATLKDAATAGPGIGGAVAGSGTPPIPPGVLQAYQNGQMSEQDAAEFEHDVRGGAWQLPAGVTPDSLFGPSRKPAGLVAGMVDAITGDSRKTPQTEAAGDWTQMPSLDAFSGQSVGVGKLLKIAAGTLLSNPQETAQILQANIPGLQVHQDQRGNFLFTDPADGKSYAYKPGFRASDIPRAVGGAVAFTPAGRAETVVGSALANAGTQAAIEGGQALAGGNFDPGEVGAAAVLGAAVPVAGRVLNLAAAPAKALVGRVLGRAEPAVADARAAVTPGGTAEAAAPAAQPSGEIPQGTAPAAPAMPAEIPQQPPAPVVQPSRAAGTPATPGAPQSVEGMAQAARVAAEKGAGSGAARDFAAAVAPDAETVAAADRLGVSGALQPDHVTTNDAFRQTVAILKSANPVSNLAQGEKAGLEQVSKRAADVIDEIGGTTDLSTLDSTVKSRMQSTHQELAGRESALWNQLRESIPATTETPASNTLAFLEQRAKDLGGVENLSPFERTLLSKLSPKAASTTETVAADPDKVGLMLGNQPQKVTTQSVKQPTYALVDNLRRQAGRMSELNGAFSDADTGLAKHIYGHLSTDLEATANGLGRGDLASAAKAATVTRKAMEDDLAALFGKRLNESLVPQLSSAMNAAGAGATAPLLAILKATPDSMKQEMVASGLASVFRTAATRGEISFTTFAKWFENLQRNKQAYAAVMSNLPAKAAQQIVDLARVSKGISNSLAARIGTGRLKTVVDQAIQAPDTLAARLFEYAKHAGKGLAVDAIGGHGAGAVMAFMSALKGAKPNAMKAIDELLISPEFKQLAMSAGTPQQAQAARAFAYSKGFTKLVRALGNPRELSNREKWVLQALQTRNNSER